MRPAELSLVAALGACGSSHHSMPDAKVADATKQVDAPASAPATVTGNLDGTPFGAQDAIWANVSASGFDFDMMSTAIVITSFPGACAHQMAGTGVANEEFLIFVLATTDAGGSSSPITAAGSYAINPSGNTPPASSMLVEAYFERDDAMCTPTTKAFGMSGTVTVTSATDPQQATFDVTFDNGDHVTGSYRAASCTAIDLNTSPTC